MSSLRAGSRRDVGGVTGNDVGYARYDGIVVEGQREVARDRVGVVSELLDDLDRTWLVVVGDRAGDLLPLIECHWVWNNLTAVFADHADQRW